MKQLYAVLAVAATLIGPASSQTKNPFLGRWDLVVTSPRGTANQWMEIIEKDGKLDGRIQPGGGAVRPIVGAKMDGSHLIVTVAAATDRAPETTWDVTTDGAKVTGVQKRGENADTQIAGVRAPELKRPMPKAWTNPEPLLNGKDLTGWEVVGNPANSHWLGRGGGLGKGNNSPRGGGGGPRGGPAGGRPGTGKRKTPPPARGGINIKTTRKFDDFKLHIEVNCPEHGNSGICLRGRYEIQVGTEGGTVPSHEMGAIYGYRAPDGNLPNGLGAWSTFDITFVGRTVMSK